MVDSRIYQSPMAVEYDFWLLDLDGTLIDVEDRYIREVLGEVGNRLGYEFSRQERTRIWHTLGGSANDPVKAAGLDPEQFWTVFHEVEDPQARADATYLYDDATFVADLETPVGLITHCQQYLTEPVLDRLDIGDWFDTVVCCSDETGWKPDPLPVELTMRELGVGSNGHAGVLAGDGPHDVAAAWNTGLDAIHIERHGPDVRGLCVLGDHRVRRFTDLDGI